MRSSVAITSSISSASAIARVSSPGLVQNEENAAGPWERSREVSASAAA